MPDAKKAAAAAGENVGDAVVALDKEPELVQVNCLHIFVNVVM